jgi:hypothetical protein
MLFGRMPMSMLNGILPESMAPIILDPPHPNPLPPEAGEREY